MFRLKPKLYKLCKTEKKQVAKYFVVMPGFEDTHGDIIPDTDQGREAIEDASIDYMLTSQMLDINHESKKFGDSKVLKREDVAIVENGITQVDMWYNEETGEIRSDALVLCKEFKEILEQSEGDKDKAVESIVSLLKERIDEKSEEYMLVKSEGKSKSPWKFIPQGSHFQAYKVFDNKMWEMIESGYFPFMSIDGYSPPDGWREI